VCVCVSVYTPTHTIYTLSEVFSCFFLSCKANARVELAKMEHGSHLPNVFLSLYRYVCGNVNCNTATGCAGLLQVKIYHRT
jgi:hypothetical protein